MEKKKKEQTKRNIMIVVEGQETYGRDAQFYKELYKIRRKIYLIMNDILIIILLIVTKLRKCIQWHKNLNSMKCLQKEF